MKLISALRVNSKIRMAIVGAGGKTTTMFRLAREFESSVILTTTTHLGIEQVKYSDSHLVIDSENQFDNYNMEDIKGVVLFTSSKISENRVSGLDEKSMLRLFQLAEEIDLPLIIEADGSRCLPLKAPGNHEPAIPPWVNYVINVAGLNALGKPLDAETVHRPEIFAELSGIHQSEIISPFALSRVLAHPDGGLKNIPTGARRVLLLNKADKINDINLANKIIEDLDWSYDAILVSSLKQSNNIDEVSAVHEPIAGIILAAGGSTRFGQPKILLEWNNKPLIRSVAEKAINAGLKPVIVVLGAVVEPALNLLADLPVKCVVNSEWEKGQSSSVICGLMALPHNAGAALFMLSDQPQIPAALIKGLIQVHQETLSPIVSPKVGGKRANPVLFDRVTFNDFFKLSGDVGGRQLFNKFEVNWLTWDDDNILLDVDSPDDYIKLKEQK